MTDNNEYDVDLETVHLLESKLGRRATDQDLADLRQAIYEDNRQKALSDTVNSQAQNRSSDSVATIPHIYRDDATRCTVDANSAQVISKPIPHTNLATVDGPEGLGGWLAWVIVSLCLMELLAFWRIIQNSSYYGYGLGSEITNLLAIENGFNILGIFLVILTIVSICMKKKTARYLFIIQAVFWLIASLIDFGACYGFFVRYDLPLDDFYTQIGQNIVYCGVWITYFATSKRVKNTLV
ncbi:hypothetical protein FACS1894125_6660 [Actinomycetota bacterium]|nr:hypothetical protein FACS1894125_6660 [Actinomycetota bacterium]